ncbi:MAG: Cof-type HAD-IIB family hydrolase [Christensenella sp.]|uniref:Cof-type HAD-IIB family hydrolase n=1 Tax=Christensenella sp. TaxID=1935934 RepID=UPI002B1F773F|nr:Cof-type HAD-IIB family hydrolase [Christensenella sp.]MEA5004181.1 Cof-type HAD-IIB family hydrolase [Christensenella sp.]
MAYKLIALDLDNTLLNAKKEITPENRKAIAAAREQGVHIVLASGRAFPGIKPLLSDLGLTDYVVACGGAQVIDPWENVVHSIYLPPIGAKQVMRWAAVRDIHFQIYLDEGIYYLKDTPYADLYRRLCSYGGVADPDIMDMETVLTSKIVMVDEEEKIQEYERELRPTFPEFAYPKSQKGFLEVISPDATKGNALAFIATKLGIEPSQIIAMGDNSIDESMVEYAGLGVAMENATDNLKSIANYVCGTCEQSGVAEVINKYILGV